MIIIFIVEYSKRQLYDDCVWQLAISLLYGYRVYGCLVYTPITP
jgi:hypothetical protein